MNIPGVRTVQPDEPELLDRVVTMMGVSFTEEPWTACYLDLVTDDEAEKLALSDAFIRGRALPGVHHEQIYALDDESACLIAYRKSEQELDNDHFEELAVEEASKLPFMDEAYSQRMERAALEMEPISDFCAWHAQHLPEDYIHLVDLGVDVNARGSGAASRIMRAFFAYADEHDLSCALECFNDRLESIYTHLGFERVDVRKGEGLPVYERLMVRWPQKRS